MARFKVNRKKSQKAKTKKKPVLTEKKPIYFHLHQAYRMLINLRTLKVTILRRLKVPVNMYIS